MAGSLLDNIKKEVNFVVNNTKEKITGLAYSEVLKLVNKYRKEGRLEDAVEVIEAALQLNVGWGQYKNINDDLKDMLDKKHLTAKNGQLKEKLLLELAAILIQMRESKGLLSLTKAEQVIQLLMKMSAKQTYAAGNYFKVKYAALKLYYDIARGNVGGPIDERLILREIQEGADALGDQGVNDIISGRSTDPAQVRIPYNENAKDAAASLLSRTVQAYKLLAANTKDKKKQAEYNEKAKILAQVVTSLSTGYASWMVELMVVPVRPRIKIESEVGMYHQAYDVNTEYWYPVSYDNGVSKINVKVGGNTDDYTRTEDTYRAAAKITFLGLLKNEALELGLKIGTIYHKLTETQTVKKYREADGVVVLKDSDTFTKNRDYTAPFLDSRVDYTPFKKRDWGFLTLNSMTFTGLFSWERYQEYLRPQYYASKYQLNKSRPEGDEWNDSIMPMFRYNLNMSPPGLEDTLKFILDAGAYYKYSTHTDQVSTTTETINNKSYTTYRYIGKYGLPEYGADAGFLADLNTKYFYFGAGYQFGWRYNETLNPNTGSADTKIHTIEHKFPFYLGVTIPIAKKWSLRVGGSGTLKIPDRKIDSKSTYNRPLNTYGAQINLNTPVGEFNVSGEVDNNFKPSLTETGTSDSGSRTTAGAKKPGYRFGLKWTKKF